MSRQKDPGVVSAKRILNREKGGLALLIGNGINRITGAKSGISWNQLVENLIASAAAHSSSPPAVEKRLKRLIKRGKTGQTPASLPEIFDIIEASMGVTVSSTSKSGSEFNLQAHIATLLQDMKPGEAHGALAAWAAAHRVPVLTTNYDHCIQEALEKTACRRRRFGLGRPMSDYYPWDRYYAPQDINDPLNEFALWHIHGDRELRRSIRVGLDQYMGMVQRLRHLMQRATKEVMQALKEGQEPALSYEGAPWLTIFMRRKIWIQGLAVSAEEVSIRWLLIQRLRYWTRVKPDEGLTSGWYIHGPTQRVGPLDQERRIFFESVGLKVLEISQANHTFCNLFGS